MKLIKWWPKLDENVGKGSLFIKALNLFKIYLISNNESLQGEFVSFIFFNFNSKFSYFIVCILYYWKCLFPLSIYPFNIAFTSWICLSLRHSLNFASEDFTFITVKGEMGSWPLPNYSRPLGELPSKQPLILPNYIWMWLIV